MNKEIKTTEEIENRVIEIVEDKSDFRKPTHGVCCTCQRCGHSNDGDCICLRVYDLHLEHLLLAIADNHHTFSSWEETRPTLHHVLDKIILSKSIHDNLEENPQLRELLTNLLF